MNMFGVAHYQVFLFTGILLNLIPGADTMYIVGRSTAQGGIIFCFRDYYRFSLTHTLLVAFGLSIILGKPGSCSIGV
jgi:threonine/homoserine/homoserine lactone efflux protein